MRDMKILILGGTGAMGTGLCALLEKMQIHASVTSRKPRCDTRFIKYILGDAKDIDFLEQLLLEKWNVIIDFLSYGTEEFGSRYKLFLESCSQYMFISSARVYAFSENAINEESPRLLDVVDDELYLGSDEYALAKARSEDLLINSGRNNWTIIRPSLTYNDDRLQMPLFELNEWLPHILMGKTLIIPKDLLNVRTTMTHGEDVACAISKLIMNEKALGQIIHIMDCHSLTWKQVIDTYISVLSKNGIDVRCYYIDDSHRIMKRLNRYYQWKYARSIDRTFDNSKLISLVENNNFRPAETGLAECLQNKLNLILNQGRFRTEGWRVEATLDRITGEKSHISDFETIKTWLKYLIGRYTPYIDLSAKR